MDEDELHDALATINMRLDRMESALLSTQQACIRMLDMLGYLGASDKDIRTQLQTLEVFVGVPQE